MCVICQDDGGSKRRSCGDSAVSKGTTDSGVVLERDVPMLPGAVPRKLPPLTSEWITESEEAARMTRAAVFICWLKHTLENCRENLDVVF